MLKRSDQHIYQKSMIEFGKTKKKCGLFIDMGLGKTNISLTVASDLLDDFAVTNVLVVAPLRVANTVWKQEAEKWSHLNHLKINICTGSNKERKEKLSAKADIYVINKENVQWLIENVKWKWDMVIIDESSGFKNHKSKRFRSLRKVLKYVKAIILLTGTPSPQGLIDLWSQVFLIDNGERLGRTISNYRQRFFKPSGYMGYQYTPLKGSDEKIKELIKDICVTMKAEDYLNMPKRIVKNEYVEMTKEVKEIYSVLEKQFIVNLKNGINIESPSAGSLHNKLLQICNGSVYDIDRKVHHIHDLKIEALKEIIEDNKGENILVAYNYNHDLTAIKKAFPKIVELSKSGDEVKPWNEGKIPLMALHPASAGHGLNMQYGGSIIIWFGLNWSLELYQQLNKRIDRQGQTRPVRIIHIVMKGGMDEKLMKAVNGKARNQDELIEYLKYEYVAGKSQN